MASIKNYDGVDLSASTPANAVTGPANGTTVNVSIVNRGEIEAKVKLCLSKTSATIQNAENIYYAPIPAESTVQITGIPVANGRYLVAESDVANINIIAYGWDE